MPGYNLMADAGGFILKVGYRYNARTHFVKPQTIPKDFPQ